MNLLEDEKKSLQATVREQKQLLDGNDEEAAENVRFVKDYFETANKLIKFFLT